VLAGRSSAHVEALRHDQLGCHGALRDASRAEVRGWIDQLLGQGLLARSGGEYPTVALTKSGAQVLRGEAAAGPLSRLAPARRERRRALLVDGAGGADEQALFETLRRVRRGLADERGVPPYVVFSDATLREMVRVRPTTRPEFLAVKGVGERKCEAFGARFLSAITSHGSGGPAEPNR
jgi:ATP-dependent DNA helicase RecQ